jgi:hypothetical protein
MFRKLDVCGRRDVLRLRRIGKMLEEQALRHTVGDDEDENFRGDVYPYISVCAYIRLPMKQSVCCVARDLLARHPVS